MGIAWQDLRQGFRLVIRAPGFAVAVALTLGLGVGVNTAIFSVVRALLVRPHPFPELERLMLVRVQGTDGTPGETRFAPADYLDLQHENVTFSDVAASRFHVFSLDAAGEFEGAEGCLVSAGFFDLLGVRPMIGRAFRAEEEQPGHDDVVLLSHDIWQRRFGGDSTIVGRTVRLDGRPATVVGVLPQGFHYPLGAEIWKPLAFARTDQVERSKRGLFVVGRLKNGVTVQQARAQLVSLAARLAERHSTGNAHLTLNLLPLADEQLEFTAPFFLMLQGAAGFVLLLACVNLTSLFLARAIARQREIAIRRALGANAGRVVAHFLGETCVLALLSAGIALALASWSVTLIRTSVPPDISKWLAGWSSIRLDGSILLFGVLLTIIVSAFFALAPGFRAARADINHVLKDGGAAVGSSARHRVLRLLVVAEVGVALVLLVGAGLMIQGFAVQSRAYALLAGGGVLHAKVDLPSLAYADESRQRTFAADATVVLSALPGVESVAAGGNVPGSGESNARVSLMIEGRPPAPGQEPPSVDQQPVTNGYFRTLRIPLASGRAFSDSDGPLAPRVAVISLSLARRFWPGADPIGRRIKLGRTGSDVSWSVIVGVASDIKQNWWDRPSQDSVYVPFAQSPTRTIHLVARALGDPVALAPQARQLLQRMDATLPIGDVRSLDLYIAGPMSLLFVIGGVMTALGSMALLLAAIGVIGVLAQSLAERRREFGVRMALGASSASLLRLAMGQAVRLVAVGLVAALPIAFVLSRWMSALLLGVVGADPRVLVGVSIFLTAVALFAAYVPARRVAGLDPLDVLRQD